MSFPFSYDPFNWYWLDDSGRLFGSKGGALALTSDANYVAWLIVNGGPTPWPKDGAGAQTGAALDVVLSAYGLSSGISP